jgi:lipopolysaccharide transport system permease protein
MPSWDYMLEDTRCAVGEKLIRPSQGWVPINFSAVWQRRSLLYFLTLRDLKVRYKQTLLGAIWVALQPLLVMVVFSTVFGVLAKMPSEGLPYPVYYFCALVPWQLVANAFGDAGVSLVSNQNLITRVYFPRLIVPLSAVLARLVDFVFCLIVLLVILIYYRIPIENTIYTLPIFILLALAAGLGIGLWLAALNVRYRDVRQMTPFITQLWFFVSPIAYSASLIPERWRFFYGLNPMVGIIDGFRWALLRKGSGINESLLLSVTIIVVVLVGGLYYFRRTERDIADVV